MAAINFPDSPSDGDTHVVGQVTYTYNSAETKWKTTINSNAFLPLTGGTLSGNLTVGDVTASGTASLSGLTYPTSDGTPSQFLQTNGSGTLSFATVTVPADTNLTRGTAISLSGNTAVTFSSIPSDAKRIVISVSQYSSTASAYPRIRLGYNSGTFQTTGYEFFSEYTSSYYPATNVGYFDIYHLNFGSTFSGHIVLTNPTGNTWVQTHTGGSYGWNSSHHGGGYVDLLGTLDTIEFSGHTGTMDSGTINIFYEV